MRDASVLARPLNKADPVVEASGKVPGPGGNDDWDGETFDEVSEVKDCDLEDMGTVKLLIFLDGVFSSDSPLGYRLNSSSRGISSGAGIGSPLATATS